jgi:hypothetical protein
MVTIICIYIVTVLLTWYPLVNDMSISGYSAFPSWESFRHFVNVRSDQWYSVRTDSDNQCSIDYHYRIRMLDVRY